VKEWILPVPASCLKCYPILEQEILLRRRS